MPPKHSRDPRLNSFDIDELEEIIRSLEKRRTRSGRWLFRYDDDFRCYRQRFADTGKRVVQVDIGRTSTPLAFARWIGDRDPEKKINSVKVNLHCIVWRWENDGDEIPDDMDVSHRCSDYQFLKLCVESREDNEGRKQCHRKGWCHEKKGDFFRCPHEPACLCTSCDESEFHK